ncbi:MAG: hypothetical protein J7L77_02375 [Clostridiales bacterium]|nr:hypothetical protein [Clostridiales bacterium]
MTITTMENRNSYVSGRYIPGWHHKEIITNGATGNDVIIPPLPAGKNVTCTLIAEGTSTGKFQTTTSSDEDVKAGTATWQDWAKGDSAGTVTDVIVGQVIGVRGVSVSGEVKIEIII